MIREMEGARRVTVEYADWDVVQAEIRRHLVTSEIFNALTDEEKNSEFEALRKATDALLGNESKLGLITNQLRKAKDAHDAAGKLVEKKENWLTIIGATVFRKWGNRIDALKKAYMCIAKLDTEILRLIEDKALTERDIFLARHELERIKRYVYYN